MKNLLFIIAFISFAVSAKAQEKVKTYKVLTSCGQCNFNMNSPTGCALAVQIGGKNYWVDGSSVSDHGDEHASDGLCETVRKAEVKGTIKGKRITVTSFKLIPEKKKKKKKKKTK